MANMSYCRFENTDIDLRDCVDFIYEWDHEDISNREIEAMMSLLENAKTLVELESKIEVIIEEHEDNKH